MSRRGACIRTSAAVAVVPIVTSAALAGCGGSESPTGDAASPTTTITVFAAASLTDTFTTLGRQFEAEHSDTKIVFSFGASSTLATQLDHGAPADVFASASTKTMDDVVKAGRADEPKVFARNYLTIAVPAGNPGAVTTLADLATPGVKVALCQPAVPCGVLADKVLANARLDVRPVTREADVRATLTKVRLGEVDAGLVYTTDVKAAGATVEDIAIPEGVNASTDYPIAALNASAHRDQADAFAEYVLSQAGTTVLSRAGFATP